MKRLVAALGLVSVVVIGLPAPFAVAGGNWLEFRSADTDLRSSPRWDIFTVGEPLVAKVGYLDGSLGSSEGPFHLWIERGDAIEAGTSIPSSAIRVATFEMAPDGRAGRAVFELPALPSGLLTLSVCDDPCTERGFGFGEFVQGWLTVVQTPEEARLLARINELRETSRVALRRVRADLRVAEVRETRLRSRLDAAVDALEGTRVQVDRLTRAVSRRPGVVMIDGAAGAWIAAGAIVIAALFFRPRRRDRVSVPDTPAELVSDDPRLVEPRREIRSGDRS